MASIRDVNLTISPGRTSSRRTVSLSYEIRFTIPEVLDASVFRERVTLRGDDPIFDDHVTTMLDWWVRAESSPILRRIVRQVSLSPIDADSDTVVLGIAFIGEDEIFARVELMPFSPGSSEASSNIVHARFGSADM
jgi:hypothetical protein